MPRCCGGASCSCAIEAGQHIQIAGTGSSTDPFVIIGDVDLEVADNNTFNMTLAGTGSLASPWVVSVAYAATAKLDDLPDVNAPAPSNGQVLSWNSSTSRWTAVPPTTAAAGAVSTDTSMSGDGSAGTPLQVREDPAGFLVTRAPGLGVTDSGINQMVRKFPTVAARNAASPPPTLNTVSAVDSAPGQLDYWDGSAWKTAGGAFLLADVPSGGEFYQLSGPYVSGRLTLMTRNVLTTTDTDGAFTLIDPTELAGRAGVMTIFTQVIFGITPVPVNIQVEGSGGGIVGHAFRADDGTPYGLGTVGLLTNAYVY